MAKRIDLWIDDVRAALALGGEIGLEVQSATFSDDGWFLTFYKTDDPPSPNPRLAAKLIRDDGEG